MANNNRNSNQPRRKRNKKPVKRYSEEYSNRPNPYTGYSADGNFHPEAKKHTMDEASVADSSAVINTVEEDNNLLPETAAEAEAEPETGSINENSEKAVSRRKKNVDRNAEKKAQKAKIQARRAAVSQIAQGVAAHSVSEQIIEDIASISDVMESMAKADSKAKGEETPSAYDDLTLSQTADIHDETHNADEYETADTADIALPLILGEDDVLPFDSVDSDSSEEQEVYAEEQEASAEEQDNSEDTEVDDTAVIPPLDPADLIPVLDFDKPPAPVLNFSEPVNDESSDEPEDDSTVKTVTIEEILEAVERENLGSDDTNTIAESRDFGFGSDMIFDTSSSENWDSVIIPPDEDKEEISAETDNSENTELNRLLEACFSSDEIADADDSENELFTMSDDGTIAAEVFSKLNSELSENEYSTEDIFDITDDISDITAEAFGDDADDNTAVEHAFDIDQDDITNTASDEHEVVSVEEEDVDAKDEIDETEAAVNAKLQKLMEAAELAELVSMENEEAETIKGGAERNELSAAADEGGKASDKPADETGEDVKEYHPKDESVQSDDVFESVLIVDDSTNKEDFNDENETKEQDDTLFLRSKATDECPTAVFRLPEGPIILPTDIDDGDFQEQWLDDEEVSDEMASRSKRARRRISAFIGAVTILFVLISVVWILKTAVIGLNNIGSTGEKKAEYTQFISPVVINDPEPFESIEGADNQMLLESAIWSVLDNADETSGYNYEYDDTGKIVLPAKEVEEAGKKLFGDDVKLNMDVLSETDGNVLYYYDSIEDKFHITTGGIIGPSANITKIAQKSDYVSLIVGYYSQVDMNSASSDEAEAYKYMEYILSFNEKGEYHIESIRDYVEE